MYYCTVINTLNIWLTLEKWRKHSLVARVFYISHVVSNARHVLSQCNTRLRLLYLRSVARKCYYVWSIADRSNFMSDYKGPGKRGRIVADTLFPTQMFPHLPARATFVADTCPGHKKCFWFCSETFCVRNKCFPVCAAQETSWATMSPQQCVLLYQGL